MPRQRLDLDELADKITRRLDLLVDASERIDDELINLVSDVRDAIHADDIKQQQLLIPVLKMWVETNEAHREGLGNVLQMFFYYVHLRKEFLDNGLSGNLWWVEVSE